MTSSTEGEQPSTTRRRRPSVVIVILLLALVVGWHLWDRYDVHNIFDAIMDAEWAISDTHKPNPALNDKYSGWLAINPSTHYRQRLQYRSTDDTIVYITIEPDVDSRDCSEYGCETTYFNEKSPTKLEISYSEAITDETDIYIKIAYDRHRHRLHEQVQIYQRHDHSFLSDDAAATVLSEHGITGDYLRQKRDWLLYEKVLPDLLAANPTVHYTAHDWGWVTVTEDRFLTP